VIFGWASKKAGTIGNSNCRPTGTFALTLIFPLATVPAFLEAHPKITWEISLTDQVIDLLEQRTDVALRSG
jgi:DNA-binding transcriptional LysR family regulator